MTTEEKILNSARKNFLLYGYYGTTIEKIAKEAGVSKAIIHYYFRTKNRLYCKIVDMIADTILNYSNYEYPDAHLTWFLVSELRNNRTMFLNSIKTKMKTDWEKKIQELIKRSMEVYSSVEFSKEN
jgi:AcrR family transcriptional regulator